MNNIDRIRKAASANGWTEQDTKEELVFLKGDTLLTVYLGQSGTILSASTEDLSGDQAPAFWAVKSHHHNKLNLVREILRTR